MDERHGYIDFGCADGVLERVQRAPGGLIAWVGDTGHQVPVQCRMQARFFDELAENIGRRIIVTGTVHYLADARLSYVDGTEIQWLPDDSELPKLEDVRGIYRDTEPQAGD